MNNILDVTEDIKQDITDNQYKIIMDSLMEINNEKAVVAVPWWPHGTISESSIAPLHLPDSEAQRPARPARA